MKFSSFVNGNNPVEPITGEEAEALDAGLRLLARFIASGIRRKREDRLVGKLPLCAARPVALRPDKIPQMTNLALA
jgi:hypothetical protein